MSLIHGRTRQTDKTNGRPHTVQLCTRSCCTWPGAARGPAARTGQLRVHRASRHRAPRQRAGPTGRGAGGLVPLWPRRMIVTKMVTTRAAKVAMTMVAMAPRRRRWWTRRRWQSSHSSICAQSTSSRERRQRSAKGRESAGACGHGTRSCTCFTPWRARAGLHAAPLRSPSVCVLISREMRRSSCLRASTSADSVYT